MNAELLKLVLSALGSGVLVATLVRLIVPAMQLHESSNAANARALEQWELLFKEQKDRADRLERQLADALVRIRSLEALVNTTG